MRFASALTTQTDPELAIAEIAAQVREQMGARKCDFAMVFVHSRYIPQINSLIEGLRVNIGVRHLVGCTGAGIIGEELEVESQPAISMLVAEVPGVEVVPFRLTQQELEEASGPAFWHFQLDVQPSEETNLLVLADPFSVNATQLVQTLNEAYPGIPLAGGLASGGQQAGENRLFLDEEVFDDGVVGLAVTGNVRLHTIVSQGCKPIGEPFTVTRADKNIIFELGGRPPLAVLQEMLPHLSQGDQQLAQKALVLGRVINEYKEDYGQGDFLIRNLIGHDPQSGALAVADWIAIGQTVQFQVRDGECADHDLRLVLAQEKRKLKGFVPHGAIVFSCLGRGQGMYGVPNHDITMLHQYFGPMATAGLFCNGEIGPIGGRVFVHGFTSVIGVFAEPVAKPAK
jgi:small ligand-binding sensory domain FIST